MQPVRVHVRNGYFVSDEPANLPEGTPVELQVLTSDQWTDTAPEDRAEIEEAIEEGYRDVENGDVEEGIAFAQQLLATTK